MVRPATYFDPHIKDNPKQASRLPDFEALYTQHPGPNQAPLYFRGMPLSDYSLITW